MGRKSTKRRHSAFAGSRKRRVVPAAIAVGPTRWSRIPVTAALIGGLLAPGAVWAGEGKKGKTQKGKPATAVESVMDRQIRNAIDAGDGDLLVRARRQKVVEEPANVEARLALGGAYERKGADELAVEHYRIAAVEYGSEAAVARLAKTLDRLGESEQALGVLVQFCDSHAGVSSSILSELGIMQDELSNLTAGEHYHQRALAAALLERAPGQDALHNNLGYNLIAQKRFAEAEAQLRVALTLNARSEPARNNLALALVSSPAATTAQVGEAILQWQSLSGPAGAHNNLAAVYLEQGRYPEARRELERALAFDRNSGAALKNLDTLAALDGKPAQLPAVLPVAGQVAAGKKQNFFLRLVGRKRHPVRGGETEVAHRSRQSQ